MRHAIFFVGCAAILLAAATAKAERSETVLGIEGGFSALPNVAGGELQGAGNYGIIMQHGLLDDLSVVVRTNFMAVTVGFRDAAVAERFGVDGHRWSSLQLYGAQLGGRYNLAPGHVWAIHAEASAGLLLVRVLDSEFLRVGGAPTSVVYPDETNLGWSASAALFASFRVFNTLWLSAGVRLTHLSATHPIRELGFPIQLSWYW